MNKHLHPIFDRFLQRSDREHRLRQRSKVLWLTGLSGSGKSTIAQHLERRLYNEGYFPQALDGDNVRTGLNNNVDFSDEGRRENIRRIAELSKLYLSSGIITINSFISPTRAIRRMAQEIIGEEDFIEIYINAPLEVCEARDVKGLYKKARAGEITGFTGIDAPYEPPENPALEVRTDQMDLNDSVRAIYEFIEPIIKYPRA
ncbi:MAG: adenylyl-sulfate kinase [Phaeodactylibacter sp.]|nr:adenylyl-sulfate kinase [Phaeodactylibacter sp.]MCB9051886.1 adenylyl-sulfate kinase [Lewinellaceae bacterium]